MHVHATAMLERARGRGRSTSPVDCSAEFKRVEVCTRPDLCARRYSNRFNFYQATHAHAAPVCYPLSSPSGVQPRELKKHLPSRCHPGCALLSFHHGIYSLPHVPMQFPYACRCTASSGRCCTALQSHVHNRASRKVFAANWCSAGKRPVFV